MCGIAGFQSKKVKNGQDVIARMKNVIRHRGPDDAGTFTSDDVTFGHVRLSIIDVAHGKQPMTTHDGRYTVVYNGEIYNYLELRQELFQKGYPLKTYSDTEVLLYMYEEHGKKMLNYLNGMFAFAIYDSVKKEVFLVRDHFGIKPLYYWNRNNQFVFASEVKALLQFPGIKAEADRDSIYEYLTFQFVLGDKTMFKNIFKIEPAQYLIVKDGVVKEKKFYWAVSYNIDAKKNEEEFADELLVLLDNSASIQIRSDVPIGAHLSGGIDSSTVATLASKNYYGSFKTFTGGFKDSPDYDETHYAKIVSTSIGSKHFTIFPTYKDFAEHFEKLVYHMDEPAAGPGVFPQYMVSKLAARNVKVVLGGQGGDEIFGGYSRYAIAYLEQCLKGAIFETQEEDQHVVTLSSIIENLPQLKKYLPLIRNQFAKGLFEDMDRRYFRMIDRSPNLHILFAPEFLRKKNDEEIFQKFSSIFNKADTKSYFNKMTHFDIKTLLPALLHVEDRVSMAVSLESRVPILDRRIVELASRMPPTMKFAGGKTKFMFLKAVENILPKEILTRKDKMGFPTPTNEWMAGPLKDYVLGILTSRKARQRGLLKVDQIERQIRQEGKFSRDLWGALNLEVWFKTFID